jgi:hypothetical protein
MLRTLSADYADSRRLKTKPVFPLSCGYNNTCSRALSLADWFCNINSRCHACGYNVGSDLSEQFGYNAGSDLSEQMCESVAPTVRQRMKSHLHTFWFSRVQKNCADFVALRNISE